jgi:hypothetical protein
MAQKYLKDIMRLTYYYTNNPKGVVYVPKAVV